MYRVRRYKVKLRHDPDGNLYQIPNSISLGRITAGSHTLLRYRGATFEVPKTIQVKDCETLKCWRCGEFGHRGKECKNTEIRNLCQEQGHTYFKCPSSYSNKARGPTLMPSTDVNTAQNGKHQSTAPQTSEDIQEAQISNEGPAQINNGEKAKSTSSISDSSDTSSGGSNDSSSEDSDSSEGILPPSGHQKESPGQEDTGAVMTSGRQLPENEGDAVLFTPDSSDSLQAGSLPPTQSSTAILSVAKKRRQRATSSSSSVQKEMKE
ncbi:dentin sialophosphoprotein-like [Pygocentrus nattereri]|uniref:dentin sialophosphoprotein-like n=1 Tax=Pygocentrus nattereri TaxID=42514 RepID=UPI0018914CCA|nr:dentin sialophosphoprotein-like [Pygocentrus nattereri]